MMPHDGVVVAENAFGISPHKEIFQEEKRMAYVYIDPMKCLRCRECHVCVEICPEEALSCNIPEQPPFPENFKCVECGQCVVACPVKAISLKK
jgi:Fe-S-cluster-containing hydrogenase component 2